MQSNASNILCRNVGACMYKCLKYTKCLNLPVQKEMHLMQCDMPSAEKLELQHQHLKHNVLERSLQCISYYKIILESIMVINTELGQTV